MYSYDKQKVVRLGKALNYNQILRFTQILTFGLYIDKKLLELNKRNNLMVKKKKNKKIKKFEVLFDLEIVEEIFFKPSTNMSSNHCVPDSEHIPRKILALP